MPIFDPRVKNLDFTQFARTSEDGNSTVPHADSDFGTELLADFNRRLIVRFAGAGGFFPGDVLPVSIGGFDPGTELDVNIISSIPLAISNFPAGFNVNNFPLAFGVNNFPAGFNVNNFPAVTNVQSNLGTFTSSSGAYAPAIGVVLAGPLTIKSFTGFIDSPAPCYLQFFNKVAVPTLGDAPKICFPIPAGPGNLVPDILNTENFWAATGLFALGFSFGLSSTRDTFTALANPYLAYHIINR